MIYTAAVMMLVALLDLTFSMWALTPETLQDGATRLAMLAIFGAGTAILQRRLLLQQAAQCVVRCAAARHDARWSRVDGKHVGARCKFLHRIAVFNQSARRSDAMTLKVLIADDARDIAEVVALGARMSWPGCHVSIAGSGTEALHCFAKDRPDLVILDVAVPPPNGFDVCRCIRDMLHVPILMLTVHDATVDTVRAGWQGRQLFDQAV